MTDDTLCKLFTLTKPSLSKVIQQQLLTHIESLNYTFSQDEITQGVLGTISTIEDSISVTRERFESSPEDLELQEDTQTVPVSITLANSRRSEIFSEWPLSTPDDAIYFIERKKKSVNILKDITFHPFNTNLFE